MTATLETVAKKKELPPESAELQAARELVRQAKEQGLSLTGPDGLLKQLTKTVLEAALDEELTEHLGHERRAPATGGNVRNGGVVAVEVGDHEVESLVVSERGEKDGGDRLRLTTDTTGGERTTFLLHGIA